MKALEDVGRIQLSPNFFMRDFLYSEISNFYGIPNIPDDTDLAVAAARGLCENLLEPLTIAFGKVSVRSAYRSQKVNKFGNLNKLNCSSNEKSRADHIFDLRDGEGRMGATATIVVNSFVPLFEELKDWRPLAWFIHDHLPYNTMYFFPKLAAFNLNWNEESGRLWIKSYAQPQKTTLTRVGMDNYDGPHSQYYDYPLFHDAKARLEDSRASAD